MLRRELRAALHHATLSWLSTSPTGPRNPETTVLYQVVAEQLETFLARQEERERPVPPFVEREFRDYLTCGVLAARGFYTCLSS